VPSDPYWWLWSEEMEDRYLKKEEKVKVVDAEPLTKVR
jgi:hypothetical protein